MTGYRSKQVNASGKRSIVFTPADGYTDLPVQIPCGQCVGCRLERSRQWAIRCIHEASLYEDNCFITLTYSPDHLPEGGTLVKAHYQKFMKRLRKMFPGRTIRYFHCGEYGDQNARPHYHACLFNFDFSDKQLWKQRDGIRLYTSPTLEKLWPYGFSTIGDVTFESAAYVARYIMKKVTGKNAASHYQSVDADTGEVTPIISEYVTMSRRPGIAAKWFEKYSSDVYPSDFIVVNGKKMKPPKFYDTLLERMHEDAYTDIKTARILQSKMHSDNQTPERLHVREQVKLSKIKSLKRTV